MRILIAPDKFKQSLDATQVAACIREGFAAVFPDAEFDTSPIADGGEGTAAVFRNALQGTEVKVSCHDALGGTITASYMWFPDRKLAVMEMSEASGLWRLPHEHLNPLHATTYGTGELLLHAAKQGAQEIYVTLGGSATNDAGVGLASALGWKFLDTTGNEIEEPQPSNFLMIRKIVPPAQPLGCKVTALCDVTNPLLGEKGATRVYGPQKGATPAMLETLESSLAHLAELCRHQVGCDFRETPGAGAAGGLGYGLLTFCDATITQGFGVIAPILNLGEKIAQSDLVITGEGKIDGQSQHGKGPVEVAKLARSQGKPVIAFAGKVEGGFSEFDACISIANGPLSLAECQRDAAELLRAAAENAARLIKISL